MKKILLIVVVIFCTVGFVQRDKFYELSEQITLMRDVYALLSEEYVKHISSEKLFTGAIRGMLQELDPYTVVMDELESQKFKEAAEGKYVGIGIITEYKSGSSYPKVSSLMEGYAADRAGLKVGDDITHIDDVHLKGKGISEVERLFAGDEHAQIKLTINREGESNPIEYKISRTEIITKDVALWSILDDKFAYLKIEHFSQKADRELREVLSKIKDSLSQKNKEVKGVILDFRNNGGGLLQAAVSIVSTFLEDGTDVVLVRGRDSSMMHVYKSYSEGTEYYKKIPLVVVINKWSASASEVVAAALQDLDRAVIVGEKSFGKGIVQNIYPLPKNRILKMTNAEYYPPSGRSLQAINYWDEDEAKENKVYKTKTKRPVEASMGVVPDVAVKEDSVGEFEKKLQEKSMYAEYLTKSKLMGLKKITIDQKMLNDFYRYVNDKGIMFQIDIDEKLTELIEVSKKYKDTDVDKRLAELQKEMKNKQSIYRQQYDEVIKKNLEIEFQRTKNMSAYYKLMLKNDKVVSKAVSILSDNAVYKKVLNLE